MATAVAKKTNKTAKVKDSVTKGINKAGDYAKSNPKTVIYVAGGIAAIYLGYKGFKLLKNIFDPKIDNNVDVNLSINQSLLTINQNQANIYASQLLDAFNVDELFDSTDENIVEDIFNKINSEDFKLIYNAFGEKPYSTLTGASPQSAGSNWFASDMDLVAWLRAEIGAFLNPTLHNKIKSIVTGAGFAY